MKLINRRCECCGASEFVRLDNKRIKCAYCDSEYIDDEPKQDIDLSRVFSSATYTIPSYVEQFQERKKIERNSEYRKLCDLRDECEYEIKITMRKRFITMAIFGFIGIAFPPAILVAIVFFFSAFAARNNIRKEYGYYNLLTDINDMKKFGLVDNCGRVWL